MKLTISKENYCATIVQIGETYQLPNCDNVVGTQIFENQVIVPKNTEIATIGVYFPTGSKLSEDYIKHNNLSRYPELNLDGEKKGYFEKHGRVKAVLFRKHESNGFFMPISSLSYLGIDLNELTIGSQFNSINGIEVVDKYVPVEKKASNAEDSLEKMGIVEGQFELHRNTKELAKNLDHIDLDSTISVSVKIHGTSAVFGKVLAHNKLSFWEKVQSFFGKQYPKVKYVPIAASRGVIKNPLRKLDGFDLWCDNANKFMDYIYDGMIVYGEIAGYYPDGKLIQKGYDYKAVKNGYNFYAYRAVKVDQSGKKVELDWQAMKDIFAYTTIKMVPERYYGKAIDLARSFGAEPKTDEELRKCIIKNLKKEIEIMEPLCNNQVPREGYVIRVESVKSKPAFKLRSFLFKKQEDEDLDAGIIDVETEQNL